MHVGLEDLLSYDSRKFNVEKIPALPGVYVLYFANGKVYVGSAINIKKRIKSHNLLRNPDARMALEFLKYKTCRKDGSWLTLEFQLIRRIDSDMLVNKTKFHKLRIPYLPKDYKYLWNTQPSTSNS